MRASSAVMSDTDGMKEMREIVDLVIDMLAGCNRKGRPLFRPLRAVPEPDRCHAERVRGNEVSRGVLEHRGARGVDARPGNDRVIRGRIRFGPKADGADVPDVIKVTREPESFQHARRMLAAAIGEDEAFSIHPCQSRSE